MLVFLLNFSFSTMKELCKMNSINLASLLKENQFLFYFKPKSTRWNEYHTTQSSFMWIAHEYIFQTLVVCCRLSSPSQNHGLDKHFSLFFKWPCMVHGQTHSLVIRKFMPSIKLRPRTSIFNVSTRDLDLDELVLSKDMTPRISNLSSFTKAMVQTFVLNSIC